jgi:predicted HTH domain antitoxin
MKNQSWLYVLYLSGKEKLMPQVVLDIPDDLLLALHKRPEEFTQDVRLAAALYYLSEKRLSLGQAARLAELTRLEFLDVLAAHNLPAFDLTATEAVAEVAAAQRPTTQDRQ